MGTGARGPVLVTGGAGYVGSFAVRALRAHGEDVVVVDDLSTGFRENVPDDVPLLEVDLRETGAVRAIFANADFDAVMHFAANAYVGESVRAPRKYWENNVGCALALTGAALDAGVRQIVFSSTCTVYGETSLGPLSEELPRRPVNPYGRTKTAVEQILEDYAHAYGLRSYRLRYFNAAGAAPDGSLGERHQPETHLVPLALGAAGGGGLLRVFGTDYPTPDGTCVRDYVHVDDLADAHLRALDRLREGAAGGALNLGTGTGTSVRDVIAAAERVTRRPIAVEVAPRRAGDPAQLVAMPGRAGSELGWTPRYGSIDEIVATAWAWHGPRLTG